MRISRNLWLTLALVAVAAVMLWTRYHAAHRQHVTDLSMSSPLNQPGGGQAPDEAYAVYTGLYQSTADEPLYFAQDSGTDIPQLNGSCLRPASPEEREMAGAFESANRRSQQWGRRFAIPAGYRILPSPELTEAQNCLASHAQSTPQCAAYKDLKHVRILGVPGFNNDRTRALVSVLKKCGPYCGTGGIFEVRKENGAWKRSDSTAFTSDCSWRY